MAAGLTVPAGAARCTRCTRTSCGRATRRRRSATSSTGSATAGRSPPGGCSPGRAQGRGRRDLRAHRRLPRGRGRRRVARPADAGGAAPGDPARRLAEVAARHGAARRRRAGDRPGGRAAAPGGPVRPRRRSPRRTPRRGPGCGWPAAAATTPAVHAAALTFVSDLTLLVAGFARLGGGWRRLRRREPGPRGVVPRAGAGRRLVPLRDRQPGRLRRPGAVLRADLGCRRHARGHRGPAGPDQVAED